MGFNGRLTSGFENSVIKAMDCCRADYHLRVEKSFLGSNVFLKGLMIDGLVIV